MLSQVDPYLRVGDDFLLYARPHSNLKEYGSEADQGASMSSLVELRKRMIECGPHFIDVIVQHLSILTHVSCLTDIFLWRKKKNAYSCSKN